jgi:hypothetical protein
MFCKILIYRYKLNRFWFFYYSKKSQINKLGFNNILFIFNSFFILKHSHLLLCLNMLASLLLKSKGINVLLFCNNFLFIKSYYIKSFELKPSILTNWLLHKDEIKADSNSLAILFNMNSFLLRNFRISRYITLVITDSKYISSVADYSITLPSSLFFNFYFFNLFIFNLLSY